MFPPDGGQQDQHHCRDDVALDREKAEEVRDFEGGAIRDSVDQLIDHCDDRHGGEYQPVPAKTLGIEHLTNPR
jgi:hypothetical protein